MNPCWAGCGKRRTSPRGGGGRVLAAQLNGFRLLPTPRSATSYPEGSHHGQAGLRNSVIEAFTGRNDTRNKGGEALVFGDGTAMDGLTLRCMADFMAVRPVAYSGRTEMCSSSTTRW